MTNQSPETAHVLIPLQERAAQAAHEVNRAYCAFLGDHSQQPWSEAPAWQRESARKGVQGVMNGNNPGDSHAGWMADKEADGWVYGERKDEQAKTHPCMVPFEALPPEQQLKDHLFVATVRAVLDMDQPEYPWPENVMQNSWTFRTLLVDIYKALAPVLGYTVNEAATQQPRVLDSLRLMQVAHHLARSSGGPCAVAILSTAYRIVAPLVSDDSKKTPESAVVTGDGPGAARLGDAVASAPAVQYISTDAQTPTVEPRFDTEGQGTGHTLTVPVDVPEGVDVTAYLEVVARDLRHRAGEHYRHRLGQGPAPTTELSDSGKALGVDWEELLNRASEHYRHQRQHRNMLDSSEPTPTGIVYLGGVGFATREAQAHAPAEALESAEPLTDGQYHLKQLRIIQPTAEEVMEAWREESARRLVKGNEPEQCTSGAAVAATEPAPASDHGIWTWPEHMDRPHYERVRSVLLGSEVEATFDEAEAPAEVKPADISYLLDTSIPKAIPVRTVPGPHVTWGESILQSGGIIDRVSHTAQLDWVPERGRWEKLVSMGGEVVLLVCFAGPPKPNVQ